VSRARGPRRRATRARVPAPLPCCPCPFSHRLEKWLPPGSIGHQPGTTQSGALPIAPGASEARPLARRRLICTAQRAPSTPLAHARQRHGRERVAPNFLPRPDVFPQPATQLLFSPLSSRTHPTPRTAHATCLRTRARGRSAASQAGGASPPVDQRAGQQPQPKGLGSCPASHSQTPTPPRTNRAGSARRGPPRCAEPAPSRPTGAPPSRHTPMAAAAPARCPWRRAPIPVPPSSYPQPRARRPAASLPGGRRPAREAHGWFLEARTAGHKPRKRLPAPHSLHCRVPFRAPAPHPPPPRLTALPPEPRRGGWPSATSLPVCPVGAPSSVGHAGRARCALPRNPRQRAPRPAFRARPRAPARTRADASLSPVPLLSRPPWLPTLRRLHTAHGLHTAAPAVPHTHGGQPQTPCSSYSITSSPRSGRAHWQCRRQSPATGEGGGARRRAGRRVRRPRCTLHVVGPPWGLGTEGCGHAPAQAIQLAGARVGQPPRSPGAVNARVKRRIPCRRASSGRRADSSQDKRVQSAAGSPTPCISPDLPRSLLNGKI
jgi:hypothetical protein